MSDVLVDDVSTGPFAVATEGVVKRYKAVTALGGIDLRVPDGAVYVLVGANGAGKSTLMRILMHLIRADAGTVHVLGIDVRRTGAEARAQIGYVPESHDLGHPWLTVGRLLGYHAAFYPAWDHAYAARLVKAFEIEPDRKCGALSKGQGRRVQLVLALAHRPPVLLLDEPGDGLDHVARDRTLSLLTEHLADSPTTVVISTHRIYEFEQLVDHVGVIDAGALIRQATRGQFQRMLRRYRADIPTGWTAPSLVGDTVLRRAALGRQIEWTVWGEERQVIEQLMGSGAVLREVGSLSLDDAAVALLSRKEAS